MSEQQALFADGSSFPRYLNAETYKNIADPVKKKLHETWRADPSVTVKEVQEALGMNMDTYYKELDRLGVYYMRKKQRKPRQQKQKLAAEKKLESSCLISFEGTANPKQLLDMLVRIECQINEKAEAYKFNFKIEEISY
jgi:hypothetical protein